MSEYYRILCVCVRSCLIQAVKYYTHMFHHTPKGAFGFQRDCFTKKKKNCIKRGWPDMHMYYRLGQPHYPAASASPNARITGAGTKQEQNRTRSIKKKTSRI